MPKIDWAAQRSAPVIWNTTRIHRAVHRVDSIVVVVVVVVMPRGVGVVVGGRSSSSRVAFRAMQIKCK